MGKAPQELVSFVAGWLSVGLKWKNCWELRVSRHSHGVLQFHVSASTTREIKGCEETRKDSRDSHMLQGEGRVVYS